MRKVQKILFRMTKVATCKYWVASRQRFCKFQISKESSDFCSVHDSGSGDRLRIPCPVDPKHMIFKKDTEKHVLKCSKVVDNLFSSRQPLILKGCNSCGSDEPNNSDENPVQAFSDEELNGLRLKLIRAREQLINLIKAKSPNTVIAGEDVPHSQPWSESVESCVSAMLNRGWDTRKEIDKHNLQNACLLEVLKTNSLTPSFLGERLYVELGCGKAGLSRWLMYSIDSDLEEAPAEAPVFLLLDYEARRHKQENKKEIQDKVSPSSVIRLRSDIRDVDLVEFLRSKSVEEIPEIEGKLGSPEQRLSELNRKVVSVQSRPNWPYKEVVGIAKHLCGSATDLGLRCLARIRERKVSIVFATCCHHRCTWSELVGKATLESLEVCSNSSDFRRLVSVAGWATTQGLPEEKRMLGRLVKSVIDLSRVYWISSNFDNIGKLEYRKYIEDGITPENFCIVLTV